jgi:hypothetical protein
MSALNSNSIHRLKKTWNLLSKDILNIYEDLCNIISNKNNFNILRTKILSIDNNNTPCIPYIGNF